MKLKNMPQRAFQKHKEIDLNVSILYAEYASEYLAKYYLSRNNIQISELIMNVLKISPNAEIKKVLKEKDNELLSTRQY